MIRPFPRSLQATAPIRARFKAEQRFMMAMRIPGTLLAGETLTFTDLPMPDEETEFAILSVFDLFAAPGDIAQDEPEIFRTPEGLRITPVTMDRGLCRLLHDALRRR